MTDVDTSPPTSPAAIDAVPLRHPWRWVAAVVIIILVALFLYGAATNPAYRWPVFADYLFNDRIMLGVWNTLQLTVYSMVLAIVLGVILAVMRLSPNPVFRSVSWVFLWIFRGTPIYVQLAFWGLIPTIYANIQLGVPFGPSFFHLNLQALSIPFILAMLGLALNEAAYMAEIIRAGISSVPEPSAYLSAWERSHPARPQLHRARKHIEPPSSCVGHYGADSAVRRPDALRGREAPTARSPGPRGRRRADTPLDRRTDGAFPRVPGPELPEWPGRPPVPGAPPWRGASPPRRPGHARIDGASSPSGRRTSMPA